MHLRCSGRKRDKEKVSNGIDRLFTLLRMEMYWKKRKAIHSLIQELDLLSSHAVFLYPIWVPLVFV